MIQYCEQYKEFIKERGVGSNDIAADSRKSYISYLNSVSRHLGIPINPETLGSIDDLENLSKKLKEKDLAPSTISKYKTAMRHYVCMIQTRLKNEA